MKKLLLTTLLITFCALFAHSQELFKLTSYKTCLGRYNKKKKKLDYDPYTYATLVFTFYPEYISVNDEARSIYRIKERHAVEKIDGVEVYKMDCIDETNRPCLVCVYTEDGENKITVMYNEVVYIYVLENQSLQ